MGLKHLPWLALVFFFFCGWLIAPPELIDALASIWFAVIAFAALAVVIALGIGLWWLWSKARQAAIILPDENGNFGLMPSRRPDGEYGYVNLNLVGSGGNPYAWAVWEYSTAKTSQPNLEQPPRLPMPRLIGNDSDATSLMIEGKAKVIEL